jgi:serine phosphatase RsbU (regulator of sigma subunit)
VSVAGASRRTAWKSLPVAARISFYAGVFALFASIAFIWLAFSRVYLSPFRIFVTVVIFASFAIGYAAAGVARRLWLIPVFMIAEFFLFGIVGNMYRHAPQLVTPDSPLEKQLMLLGIGSIASVVIGYALFIAFFYKQGSQLFRAQTEIALAGEIHRALVPAIHHKLGAFELYGASVPSGVVGGDLVDVVGDAEAWTAYVADVSGHGVAAGVLMAMFKTAVHTQPGSASPELLLREVNRTLYPLKTNNTFVTAGVLHSNRDGLSLTLAGHPALLRYCRSTGEVQEYPPADMPVGILPEETFTPIPVACEPGDVLLIVTDGLTEVFDAKGKEMGLGPLKVGLAQWASLPLPELFTRLREVALKAGSQLDDQTMLIVRRA